MSERPKPGTPLSRREHEVLSLMARGLEYGQVGAIIGITASTVGAHCMRAMARTRTKSLFQLGAWAAMHGYTANSAPVFREDTCDCEKSVCDGMSCLR